MRRLYQDVTLIMLLLPVMCCGAESVNRAEALYPPLKSHEKVKALTAKHYIFASSTGSIDIAYASVVGTICRSNLLESVQEEYSRMLPEGVEPEFTVEQQGPAQYYYVNDSAEESRLEELYMGEAAEGRIVVAFHVQGNRFFGDFESLIQVTIESSGEKSCAYQAYVFAYPESRVLRFLCRHLGLVTRYFHNKTSDMTDLIRKISLNMLDDADSSLSGINMKNIEPHPLPVKASPSWSFPLAHNLPVII